MVKNIPKDKTIEELLYDLDSSVDNFFCDYEKAKKKVREQQGYRRFNFGDYVIYNESELGRVTKQVKGTVYVCFSTGCTAASTPVEKLRPATKYEISSCKTSEDLGFHRFDDSCPGFNPSCCSAFCPEKAVKTNRGATNE